MASIGSNHAPIRSLEKESRSLTVRRGFVRIILGAVFITAAAMVVAAQYVIGIMPANDVGLTMASLLRLMQVLMGVLGLVPLVGFALTFMAGELITFPVKD